MLNMVAAMDEAGLETAVITVNVQPHAQNISLDYIAKLNRDYARLR